MIPRYWPDSPLIRRWRVQSLRCSGLLAAGSTADFEEVQKLDDDLTKAGIHHDFEPSDGAHDWVSWREYPTETLPLLFR